MPSEIFPKTMGQQFGRRSWAEPWKIKMVEPIKVTSREDRERAAKEAGYKHLSAPAPKTSTSTC